jgi:hypothetical protein
VTDAFADIGNPERLIAVGDIHGDLDALLRILLGTGLVSEASAAWRGGTTGLVLIGDLNDRGNDSVAVMDFLMGLQRQAADAGGVVQALIGNHEAMAAEGDFRYVSAVETLAVERWWFDDVNGLHAIFRGDSPYASWLRSRPVMLRAGGTLFVHAGLDRWALEHDMGHVAATVRSWIAYFQGVAPEPDAETEWMVSDDQPGPLWTDRLRVTAEPVRDAEGLGDVIAEALDRLGVDRLAVGHKPTVDLDYRIAFPHPAFGDRVALIDTGICRRYGGRLSALEIGADRIAPRYFERGIHELALTREVRTAAERNRERIAEENARRAGAPR